MTIACTGVSFAYSTTTPAVIDDLSIHWAAAGGVIILGDNGRGKSTFGKLLCGLYRPTSGVVEVENCQPHKILPSKRIKLCQYIPQKQWAFFQSRSVIEELEVACGKHQRTNAIHQLQQFALDEFANEHPLDLPDSAAWRLAVAVGASHKPKLLFIDEMPSYSSRLVNVIVEELIKQRATQGLYTFVALHRQPDFSSVEYSEFVL